MFELSHRDEFFQLLLFILNSLQARFRNILKYDYLSNKEHLG